MLLLGVTRVAARQGRPTIEAARGLGLDSRQLYRLRRRLLGPSRSRPASSPGEHRLVVDAFTERCGVERDTGEGPLEADGAAPPATPEKRAGAGGG